MAMYPSDSNAYEILSKIGGRPTAMVYKARCVNMSREEVAIKCIVFHGSPNCFDFSLRDDPSQLQMVKCAFLADDGRYWVVMPLFENRTYRSLAFKRRLGNPAKTIGAIVRSMLKQLSYLHERGKIHGDLKFGNIVIRSDHSVQIMDYGYSDSFYNPNSLRYNTSGSDHTRPDSPYWLPPEKQFSPKCDVWAVGILALELIYGRAPLNEMPDSPKLLQEIQQHFGGWWAMPQKGHPKLVCEAPPDFRDFVSICLNQDSEARPSAHKLLKHPFLCQQIFVANNITNMMHIPNPPRSSLPSEDIDGTKIPSFLLPEWFQPSRFIVGWSYNPQSFLMDAKFNEEPLTRNYFRWVCSEFKKKIEDANKVIMELKAANAVLQSRLHLSLHQDQESSTGSCSWRFV